MKIYEVYFTFNPDDPTASGEGFVTVEANTPIEAEELFNDVMADVKDVAIQEIREVVEIPENIDFTPRTLQ